MASSEYRHIRFEVEPNGVATLTFNLPKTANAMDLLGVQETLDALRRCENRSDIGAVVLTGAGEHAFSAGFNLKEIPSRTSARPTRSSSRSGTDKTTLRSAASRARRSLRRSGRRSGTRSCARCRARSR
jgi:enoyl-CoA hydratase/carnithine racemase